MPKIVYRAHDGTERAVDAALGMSVMKAALHAGLDGIVAECGGNVMCATCHVYADPARLDDLPVMESDEDEMLECAISERRPTSRLSCKLPITTELDGLIVDLPEAQT